MILKQEFYHMVNNMGLEDGDLAIAEIVWTKAERAMQGKPVQEAKLLTSTQYNPSKDLGNLTQAELQCLTDGLSAVLAHEEQVLKNLKYRIDQLWNKSNPDDKESQTYFDTMNTYRNVQRKIKKDHAKLARIQHKLKKMKGK